MNVSIQFDDRIFQQKIKNIVGGVSSFVEPLKKISDDFDAYYGNEVFATEGGAGAGKWAPLAASTVNARAKRTGYYRRSGSGGKVLTWSGTLKSGFSGTVTPLQLVFKNKVPYFKYPQLGGGRLPQRKILEVTPKAQKSVKNRMETFLAKLLNS